MNTIQYLKNKNFNGINDADEIRKSLYNKYISVSYERDLTDGKRRYIFTSKNQKSGNKIEPIHKEANGLILEAPGWKVLLSPINFPKNNIDSKIANSLLNSNAYDIYYLEDGTVIGLYYWAHINKWVISTARGIDVSDVIFNTKSYKTILDECIEKNGSNAIEFFNNLDKNLCYSFGFKHPDMHPFKEGREDFVYKLWFIQSCDIDNNFEVNRVSPWEAIPNQKKVNFTVNTVGQLFNDLTRSYDDFKNSIGGEPIVNYGFILVANKKLEKNIDYSTLLLESKLLNCIRNLWYDASYLKFSKSRSYNKEDVILLNSFIDKTRIHVFNVLFPQYKNEQDEIMAIEQKIVDKVHNKLTNLDTNTIPEIQSTANTDNIDDIIDILCQQVKSKVTISQYERPKLIIKDVIHNCDNIDFFYIIKANKLL